jgi:hypothetical protein
MLTTYIIVYLEKLIVSQPLRNSPNDRRLEEPAKLITARFPFVLDQTFQAKFEPGMLEQINISLT